METLKYYKVQNNLFAGEYPYAITETVAKEKLRVLDQLKTTHTIDLTEEGELSPIFSGCT